MSHLKKFDESFGLRTSENDERKRFLNRIEQTVFGLLMMDGGASITYQQYEYIFEKVCYELGENAQEIINNHRWPGQISIPNLKVLGAGDFLQTLRVIVALYHALDRLPHIQPAISAAINDAIDKSNTELGIRWVDGVFFPVGEPILDRDLVEESLNVLTEYPNEKKDISLALENYQRKRLDGVVENCYLAVEGLCRQLLENGKTLLNNKQELLQTLSFSRYWGNIVSAYIDYANDYRRHAGEQRHDLKSPEVEAFLYLTCLVIRAIMRTNTEK